MKRKSSIASALGTKRDVIESCLRTAVDSGVPGNKYYHSEYRTVA